MNNLTINLQETLMEVNGGKRHIVRSLVEMHEGRVGRSKVNEGSKFIISLPKKTVATENVQI